MATKHFLSIFLHFIFIGVSFAAGHTLSFTVSNDCGNSAIGSATVQVTGGTGPFIYSWSNSETTATISGLVAGTYSVTVTDQSDNSTATASCDIENIEPQTPLFTMNGIICEGGFFSFNTTADNGFVGTWAPVFDNTTTTTYIFTPNAGQCATTTNFTVIVQPKTNPSFTPVGPYCQGESIPPLLTNSTNIPVISGTWNPAIDFNNSTTYTFTPNPNECANTTTLTITINPQIIPTFNAFPPICFGESTPFFPSASNEGFTGTWNPSTISNHTSTTYTFTPDQGQCARTSTLTITVGPLQPTTFAQIPTLCAGETAPSLPSVSTEGIPGTWSPTFIDNTVTATYTFTPYAGYCAESTSMTVFVNPSGTPTFDPIPPICAGDPIPTLPIQSKEGIDGTWNPAVVDNQQTGMYTFTPNAGLCISTVQLVITVGPPQPPLFTPISPFCEGSTQVPTLPNVSDNGVSGTWNPATINNFNSATYTFTPNGGICASTTSMSIVINPKISPAFSALPAFCSGSAAPVLSEISNDGVQGTWVPSIVSNITSGTYTFTPTEGQCATTTTLMSIVNSGVTINSFTDDCSVDNTNYTVTVTLDGGNAPFTTSAANPANFTGSFNGNVWTSNPIPSGTNYYIQFADISGCSIGIGGQKFCNCDAAVGTMSSNVIQVCGNGAAVGTYNAANENLGANFIKEFILHTNPGNTIGTIVNRNSTPEFSFTTGMTYGMNYYISAVVGEDDGSGHVNLTANCLKNSVGQAVIWHETPQPIASSNSPVCVGSSLNLNVTTFTGATYLWTGPNSFSSSVQNPKFTAQANHSGTYTVTVSLGACIATSSTSVTVSGNGQTVTFDPIPPICQGDNAPILPSVSKEGIQGTWSPPVVDNQTSGTYFFTSNSGNCVSNSSMLVVVNPLATPTFTPFASICVGDVPPTLQSTSNEGVAGIWIPSIVDNNTTGSYTFTPNPGQCYTTGTTTVTVTPQILPTFNAIPAICEGSASPFLPSTSNEGFIGTWSPSGIPQTAGVYTFTFTPSVGQCAMTSTLTITVNAISLMVNTTQITACKLCDGTAQVSGTFSKVLWRDATGNTLSTTPNLNQLCAGTYSVFAENSNGCKTEKQFKIEDNVNITIAATITNENCGASDGNITTQVTGDNAPFTYQWKPLNTSASSLFNIKAGKYELTVYDNKGCFESKQFDVVNNGAATVVLTKTDSDCNTQNGSITVNPVSGATYSINGGAYGSSTVFSNLGLGKYTISIKTSNGCISLESIEVLGKSNLLTTLTITRSNCNAANGKIKINLPNGETSVSYLWNTNQTTSEITNIISGNYTCVVTDNLGCKKTVSATVNPIQDLYLTPQKVVDRCGTNTVTALVNGGQKPYSYLWTAGGQTTQNLFNVSPGVYTVEVTDALGCKRTGKYTVETAKEIYATGFVFEDLNKNCVKDANEKPLKTMVYLSNNNSLTYGFSSNQNGFTSYLKNEQANLKVSTDLSNQGAYIIGCAPLVVETKGDCSNISFNIPLQAKNNTDFDLEVSSYCGIARPGRIQHNYIYYKNNGPNKPGIITIKADFDPFLKLQTSNPSPTRIVGSHLEWDFNSTDVAIGTEYAIYLQHLVPLPQQGANAGRELNHNVLITPTTNDFNKSNNDYPCSTIITNSHDPNAKYVKSKDAGRNGEIDSSGAVLEYHIDFQNTGNDTAFVVVVRDTLSPLLNLETIRFIGATHKYEWSVNANRVLEVRFDDILLVDSNRNEPLSHGGFDFSIRTIDELPLGAKIKNTVDIYFDFNDPVITNTVVTPVVAFLNVPEQQQLKSKVYPNPLQNEQLNVQLKGIKPVGVLFELRDANGRLIHSELKGDLEQFSVQLSGLNAGMYFFTISNNNGEKETGKLIVSH